jgi:hypothetical protein
MGQSRMEILETLTILGTYDTGRRQVKLIQQMDLCFGPSNSGSHGIILARN